MLDWSAILMALSAFGVLITVLLQFVGVRPTDRRLVTIRTMGLIMAVLFLFSLYMVTQGNQPGDTSLGNIPASEEPTALPPVPASSPTPDLTWKPSPTSEPSPTPGVQTAEPTESVPAPTERPTPSQTPETNPPTPLPTAPSQDTFLLEAFDNISYTSDDIHLEYRGPNDGEYVLDRFPLELPMVPGYYYVKIHRDGTCRELAQASFYVDDSVAGYAIGFRRILSWGLYDAGEVDKNCLLCSWGYRALPTANLRLTLVDGQQFQASGLEVRVRCEEFDSDVFCCTYLGEPLWFSLPPGYNYSVTVSFDSFTAAEESFQVNAPQDGTSPQTLQLQLT